MPASAGNNRQSATAVLSAKIDNLALQVGEIGKDVKEIATSLADVREWKAGTEVKIKDIDDTLEKTADKVDDLRIKYNWWSGFNSILGFIATLIAGWFGLKHQ